MLLEHAVVWTSAGFISDWCSEPVNAINGCCLGNLGVENEIQNFVNYKVAFCRHFKQPVWVWHFNSDSTSCDLWRQVGFMKTPLLMLHSLCLTYLGSPFSIYSSQSPPLLMSLTGSLSFIISFLCLPLPFTHLLCFQSHPYTPLHRPLFKIRQMILTVCINCVW